MASDDLVHYGSWLCRQTKFGSGECGAVAEGARGGVGLSRTPQSVVVGGVAFGCVCWSVLGGLCRLVLMVRVCVVLAAPNMRSQVC